MSIEIDQEKYKLDPDRWVGTLPGKRVSNSNTTSNPSKKYFLTTIIFVFGIILVSAIKNETKNLQKEINTILSSINILKLDLHQTTLDHEVITSPENISQLAKKYLELDFVSYQKSQIRHLNVMEKTVAKLEEKKHKNTFKKENKVKTSKIKLRVVKQIELTKTELRKLQELYSEPEKLPEEIKIQVAKKIEIKKNELKQLYSDPYSIIMSKRAQKWVGLQVVKVFLGIPIIPGR